MIRAKKSLGQNFLQSEKVIFDIVGFSGIHADDVVVEIGPGEGILTKHLLMVSGKVIAIEKDRRLISELQEKFQKEIESGKLDLIEKDALDFDFSMLSFYKNHTYKVVANIPYYITGQIIRKLLENSYQPQSITLLVQKEVAERIVARDGKESLLSLSVKAYGTPKYIRTVGRGAFRPQPGVDSAVIHINNISRKNFEGLDENFFFKVIHAGFAHKRKQLLPNLSSIIPKEKLKEAFEQCGLVEKARAEDLSLEMWLKLSSIISK